MDGLAQEAFVADTFGDEPEDTDPGGADLTDSAAIAPGAHRSTQTKYGVGVSRCVCHISSNKGLPQWAKRIWRNSLFVS